METVLGAVFGARRRVRTPGISWCFWLWLGLWPAWAWGHAGLLSSEPAAGAALLQSPMSVSLRYSEPVHPLVMRLAGPSGSTWTLAAEPLDAAGWRVPLPALSAPGVYVLSWRVVSEDGHPVGGTVPFSWGQHQGPAADGAAASPVTARTVALWSVRWGLLAGLVLAVGMAGAVWWSVRAMGVARRAWPLGPVLVLVCVALAWLLQGLDALDAPWSQWYAAAVWRATAETTMAAALAWMLAAGGMAWWAVRSPVGRGRALAVIALVCAATALAVSGHAAAAPPAWLARPMVWLHAMAVMLWAGALWPLVRALWADAQVAEAMLARFSRAIPWVLVLLVGSGVVLVALQWGGDDLPWQNGYGRVLLLKLLGVAGLLALGAWNRWHLKAGRVQADDTVRWRAIRRVVIVECVLVLAVLGAAAAWRFTPPPRVAALQAQLQEAAWCAADQAAADEPAMKYAEVVAPGLVVELAWWQPVAAAGEIELFLSDGQRLPMSAQAVQLVFEDPSGMMEPSVFDARLDQDGVWRVAGVLLPERTGWRTHIEVLVTDFDRWRATLSW